MKDRAQLRFLCSMLPLMYVAVAFMVFQWRNPLANRMSIYRDFLAVVRFEKLDCYQPR